MTGEQVGGSEGKGVIMCHRERHMMSCNPSITCTVQDSNQRREPVCLESTVLMTRQEKKNKRLATEPELGSVKNLIDSFFFSPAAPR